MLFPESSTAHTSRPQLTRFSHLQTKNITKDLIAPIPKKVLFTRSSLNSQVLSLFVTFIISFGKLSLWTHAGTLCFVYYGRPIVYSTMGNMFPCLAKFFEEVQNETISIFGNQFLAECAILQDLCKKLSQPN